MVYASYGSINAYGLRSFFKNLCIQKVHNLQDFIPAELETVCCRHSLKLTIYS